MKLMPYIILALIAAAGVQKFGNRPVEPQMHMLTVEAEQPVLGEWAPAPLRRLAFKTFKDEQGARFTHLSVDRAEVGASFCAQVTRGKLLGDRNITEGSRQACG